MKITMTVAMAVMTNDNNNGSDNNDIMFITREV